MPRTAISPQSTGVVILGGAHGALALARSLGRSGIRVHYISNDSPLTGWSRFVQKQIKWPGADHVDATAFLIEFARKNGLQGSLLVPAGDAEVMLVSKAKQALQSEYNILLPDWQSLQWLCDKPLLYKRAEELGLQYPRTNELASTEEAHMLAPTFPVILKPNMGGGNSRIVKAKVIKADDKASFIDSFTDAAGEIGARNVVVQELIPGGGESQFSYVALWSEGKPVAEFTARRTRQYPVDFGFTSTYVEVISQPALIEASHKLLSSLAFSGLVEIEFKRHPLNGSLNILDVNPRPWAWLALSSAAGVDFGPLMWDAAQGKLPSNLLTAHSGTAWIYAARDLAAAITLIKRGKLKARSFFGSFFKVRAMAAFSWNDPLPGFLDLPLTAWRVLTRRIFNLSKK
ncbi:ATP-grasp domain-containing protein [Agrobacterium sp.]|uniref:carboxylate--amine ligase n=1 Tax=Agrobacterium sp. TaxID=361 RepID=UPI0028A5EACA|nr:ATP-grasp domain-containing protein [Agrobacterium sp.]